MPPEQHDEHAAIIPELYDRLRAAARRHVEKHAPGITLQPTALVHEAFLKLAASDTAQWENRAHFLSLASRIMRQILIDAARARNRRKRGGDGWTRIAIEPIGSVDQPSIDLLALAEALDELEGLNEQQSRIVEMHFLGGMTFEDIARALDVPLSQARSDWYMARAWLRKRLADSDDEDTPGARTA